MFLLHFIVPLCFLLVTCIGDQPPNIVYILTDDQDLKLGSLEIQEKVQKLLVQEGMVFENAFVTTPVCCPSRASILTGRYPHNTGTYENTVPYGCASQSWRDKNEPRTIGAILSANGYRTGFFGKYLNMYALPPSGVGPEHVPLGWTKWFGLVGNSVYYNYDISNDGKREHHGADYTTDYLPDLVKNESVKFIQDASDLPFFMYIAPPAPHRPATPAPQYNATFAGKPAPRTPSYGYKGSDKHWLISTGTPVMNNSTREQVDQLYEDRLATLLSVQDMVEAVIDALERKGVLKNTFVVYNSDHGYHLGQFNQQGEKRQPYDEDIRVPLIVRGPGVTPNTRASPIALSIDMFPTFLDLAGVQAEEDLDGRSLKSIFLGEEEEATWRSDFLVEYYGEGGVDGCFDDFPDPPDQPFLHDCHNNTFLALRTFSEQDNSVFAYFYKNDSFPIKVNDRYFEEYYDLVEDNWELVNTQHELDPAKKEAMAARIKELYSCHGKSCQ